MTFHETVYTLRVLSEDPIPPESDLSNVLEEATTGAYVADLINTTTRTIDGPECAKLLYEYGSEPRFFNLTDGGEKEDEGGL
jgi:hypothetical protein